MSILYGSFRADWTCPVCQTLNFGRRIHCWNRGCAYNKRIGLCMGHRKMGDWICPCGNLVFANKSRCGKCHRLKKDRKFEKITQEMRDNFRNEKILKEMENNYNNGN